MSDASTQRSRSSVSPLQCSPSTRKSAKNVSKGNELLLSFAWRRDPPPARLRLGRSPGRGEMPLGRPRPSSPDSAESMLPRDDPKSLRPAS